MKKRTSPQKRITVVLGLAALVLVFSLPQIGIGQPAGVSQAATGALGVRAAQAEMQLLAAINRAGISLAQLETIYAAVQSAQDAQGQAQAAQAQLKDFLLSWNGAPEDFDAAFAEARQQFQELQPSIQVAMQQLGETVANTLTIAQGQILKQSFSRRATDVERGAQLDRDSDAARPAGNRFSGPNQSENDRNPSVNRAPQHDHKSQSFEHRGSSGGRPGGPRGFNEGRPQRDQRAGFERGPQNRGGSVLGGFASELMNLDVLARVLSAKIVALKAQ